MAWAGPSEVHGYGAEAMGRGGGGVALATGGEDVFLNPAALAAMPVQEASLGFHLLRSDFPDVPSVWWDTNRDGLVDDSDPPLELSADTEAADAIAFMVGRPVGDRFGLSLAGSFPLSRVLRIETFEPALPNYILYDNRRHRFELALGFGWEQLPGVRVGGAVQVIAQARYALVVTLDVGLQGAAEDAEGIEDLVREASIEAHNMTLDIIPGLAPVASLHWDMGELLPAVDGLHLATVFRGASGLPVDVSVDIQANIGLDELGELEPVTLAVLVPLELSVFDHYIPDQLTVGLAWQREDGPSLYLDGVWTGWKKMRLSVAQFDQASLASPLVDLGGVEIVDGNQVVATLENTLGVRGGVQYPLPPVSTSWRVGELRAVARAGGSYAPSPLVAQSAQTALLDADRVGLGAGLGLAHADPLDLIAGPVSWDVYAQLHWLGTGSLAVDATPYRPGAPVDGGAVPVGGRLWATGLQWSIGF